MVTDKTPNDISKKKDIVFTANTSWYLLNFRKSTLKAFIETGYTVHCVAPKDEYSIKLAQIGCHYHNIPLSQYGKNPVKELIAIAALLRILRKSRPACVFSFSTKSNIYTGLVSHVLPFRFCPNISGLGQVFTHGGFFAKALLWLYRFSLKNAYKVIFQNAKDKSLFEKKHIVKKETSIRVHGSGVNLEEFHPPKNKTFSNRPLKFAMISRLLVEKGVLDYLDAAKIVLSKKTSVEFYLVGSPPNTSKYPITKEMIAEQYGSVNYIEHSDQIKELIKEFDFLVLPTYYNEGVPKSLLEGLASGLIIFTTNTPGCSETIDKQNINGYLTSIKSPHDIAKKMIDAIEAPPETLCAMSEASLSLARSKFDDKLNISEYISIASSESNLV